LEEWQESGSRLTSEHVALTCDPDLIIFLVDDKTGISVAPSLLIDVIGLNTLIRLVINNLGVGSLANLDKLR
jgi:hypothetical protein